MKTAKTLVCACLALVTAAGPAWAQTGSGGRKDPSLDAALRSAARRETAATGDQQTLRELTKLEQRYDDLEREVAYAEDKLQHAKRKLVGAKGAGDVDLIEKWAKETKAWEARLAHALAQQEGHAEKLGDMVEAIRARMGTATAAAAAAEPTSEVILPGETLEVFVAEDEAFNNLYQVRRGGYIIVPQVGRVTVAGRTQKEAEAALKKRLEQTQLRKATVIVERQEQAQAPQAASRGTVYLVGQWVSNQSARRRLRSLVRGGGYHLDKVPGAQPLIEHATVVTTVLTYGTRDYADLEHVKLLRLVGGKGLLEEVNVKAVLDGDELASDIPLADGDIIVVPRAGSTNRVYITGRVEGGNQLLQLPPDEELTAYKAVLRAGGFSRFANLRKVYVLRDLGSGAKTRIPVNVKDVQRGRVPDVVLQANDIIVVPEKFFSF